jgi:IS605 OrfB family transposase
MGPLRRIDATNSSAYQQLQCESSDAGLIAENPESSPLPESSQKIVEKAQRTNSAIVLEDLQGIRGRVRVQKARRAEVGSWGFGQLRSFIEYKAKLVGVVVITVDPRNTSRQCSQCGHIDKLNRRSQKVFPMSAMRL